MSWLLFNVFIRYFLKSEEWFAKWAEKILIKSSNSVSDKSWKYCVEASLIFFNTSSYDCIIITTKMFNFLPKINS